MARLLADLSLHTVCREAHCPNQGECFSRGTAAFLLLGPTCSRRCAFCAVDKGRPARPSADEPRRTARAVAGLGLEFCVLTMVTRDDLADGGAAHVARAIRSIRDECPGVGVEVLISDLGGDLQALEAILKARPEVLNHNLETVPRLYPAVRPQADYRRSLKVLKRAALFRPRPIVKSGLMLGLGETRAEVLQALDDLSSAGCDAVTLGQYLAPSDRHFPVARFVSPQEFDDLAAEAQKRGFAAWAFGPYVRSSYRAGELFHQAAAVIRG